MTIAAQASVEPVTVIIRRRVKPGCEAAYEAWLQRLQAEVRSLDGYLGVTTQRPTPQGPSDYVCAVRFASLASLREPVDRFFDQVMVMAEDPAVRANRLALLGRLHRMMNGIADLSALSVA